MWRYQEVRPQNDPQSFAVKGGPVSRPMEVDVPAGSGWRYRHKARPTAGRNISVSGVMSSAQLRYRPSPLTWSEDQTIGAGTD